MSGVLRTQLGGAARRPSRLILTGLAVLVASFVVYATVLAQRITERSMLDGLSTVPAAATLVAEGEGLTTAQLAAIERIPGVTAATGRTTAGGEVAGQYLAISADPGAGALATASVSQGRYPSKPGEIAVTPRTADRMGLPIGATVRISTSYDEDGEPTPPVPLTVVGIAAVADDFGQDAYAPQSVVSALNRTDLLDRVELQSDPGVRDEVAALLGSKGTVRDAEVVRTEEAAARADGVTELFAVIAMFVAVAVVAAALVAASTFRIVFAQRMRQLALLRTVGAGRGSLVRALAVEGMVTGLLAGLIGVLIAFAAGQIVPAAARAAGASLASPGVPWLEALGVLAMAMVITVLAVLAPAFSASRVAPLEALRAASTTAGKPGIGWLRWVVGLLFTAGAGLSAGYVLLNLPGRDEKNYTPDTMLLAVVGSGALAFFALIALGPVLVRPILAAAGWPLRRMGPLGRLAVGGVGGAPRRAAAVSVVVALGVTLIAGVLVGGASVRALVDREVASSVPADFEATASEPLAPAVVERARSRPELTHVTPYRRVSGVSVGPSDVKLEATDLPMDALPQLAKLDVEAGRWQGLRDGQVVLSGFTSEITSLRVGDRTTIRTDRGTVPVTVAALLPDSAPLGAGLVLTAADLARLGAPTGASGLLADTAKPGEQARTEAQKALRQAVAGPGVGVAVLADKRDEINSALDTVLLIAIGLIGLTVLIAVVGVGTTTALSVVERARESGLLRALGLSRAGLRATLTTESGLYGAIGAAIGLLLGVPYAWLAVEALGVNAPLALPVRQLALVFAVLVVITALAGVLPARRAAKVSPVTALAAE